MLKISMKWGYRIIFSNKKKRYQGINVFYYILKQKEEIPRHQRVLDISKHQRILVWKLKNIVNIKRTTIIIK